MIFWRKVKWMLIALLMPEFITALAMNQFLICLGSGYLIPGYSFSQLFYINFGGLRHRECGQEPQVITREQFEKLSLSLGSPISDALPSVQDLWDRSKSDQLTKGLAILQTAWFIGQCISRAHHGLAISELEVGTAAFVACTFLTYLFWWAKPMDVKMATILRTKDVDRYSTLSHIGKPRIRNFERLHFFKGDLGWYSPDFHWEYGITNRIHQVVATSDFSFFLAALIATNFGVVHVAAWRFLFPSTAELMIWRVCSLLITLVPLTTLLIPPFIFFYNWRRGYYYNLGGMDRIAKIARISFLLCMSVYFAARIILLVQMFLCFRSMPADVYVTVEWLQYVPHI
jgi:hypothetical protein